MQRIQWPTVQTDVRRVAVDFQEAFAAIMARLAQALQLPEVKLVHIAMMRLDAQSTTRRSLGHPGTAEPATRAGAPRGAGQWRPGPQGGAGSARRPRRSNGRVTRRRLRARFALR